MSSVQSAVSQISNVGTHLISLSASTFYADFSDTRTVYDAFVVGTNGVQSKSGSVVVVNTVANVATNLAAASLAGNAFIMNGSSSPATAAGDNYRDMGKTFTVYTLAAGSGPALPFATFTRVRLVKGDATNVSEGENGRMGYLVTRSAVPTGTAAYAVTVARIGAGYGSTF